MTNLVGQQLGNYRLLRVLGQGGYAEVYLAQHLQLQTQAAIKVLQGPMTPGALKDFRREAQVIATLRHPHIVSLFDFDVQNGVPFLVMDYASGGSLAQRHAQSTRVPLSTVLSYVKPLGEALQFAHDQRVMHRDLKPENILIGRRSELLLSDFGIATMISTSSSVKTQTIVGTTPYMAPEQILGKPVAASDQYALGVIIYSWLCGKLPFTGSVTEIITQHLAAPPPSLRALSPAIPPHVEQVITTALAKEASARFATVKNFVTAFEQALEDAQPGHPANISLSESETPTLKTRLSTFFSSKKRGQLERLQPLAPTLPASPAALPPTLPAPAPQPDSATIDRAYEKLRRQAEQRTSDSRVVGALVVRTAAAQVGQVVHIQQERTWKKGKDWEDFDTEHAYVKEYVMNDHPIAAAVFKRVMQDAYYVWVNPSAAVYAVVSPGEATLVDLRQVSKIKKSKK